MAADSKSTPTRTVVWLEFTPAERAVIDRLVAMEGCRSRHNLVRRALASLALESGIDYPDGCLNDVRLGRPWNTEATHGRL